MSNLENGVAPYGLGVHPQVHVVWFVGNVPKYKVTGRVLYFKSNQSLVTKHEA